MPDKEVAKRMYEMGMEMVEMAKMYGYTGEESEESMDPMAEEEAPAAPAPLSKPGKGAIIIALKKKMGKAE